MKRPDTLNRCPFCLPERSQPNLTKRSAASHFVECLCCMATGPLCGDEPTAIRTWNEGCFGARQSSEILGNTVDAHVEFWKAEYKSLARAGVERMAEFGYQVDPAEKMIEAAEYREKRILGKPREPKRESGWDARQLKAESSANFYEAEYERVKEEMAVFVKAWPLIDKALTDYAIHIHIRGGSLQPIPEIVEAKQLYESITSKIEDGAGES